MAQLLLLVSYFDVAEQWVDDWIAGSRLANKAK
jgi:hypothetical protein